MRQPYHESLSRNAQGTAPVDRQHNDGGYRRRASGSRISWTIIVGTAILTVLVMLVTAIAFPKQFKHQLAISFLRQKTPYTQLYFTDPYALSGQLSVGKENSFDFTITNNEDRTYKYTYTITLQDPKSSTVVSIESVTIPNTDSVTRTATVLPKDHKSRYLISVALQGMNQSIHFYAETS